MKKIQFKIRFDEDLHSKLTYAADHNFNSLNSEIVSRLEVSILMEKPKDALLTAKEAQKIAAQSRKNRVFGLMSKCLEEIATKARIGATNLVVDIPDYESVEIHYEEGIIHKEVIEPVVNQLEDIGYSVQAVGLQLYINF